jgi:hypothetical protein
MDRRRNLLLLAVGMVMGSLGLMVKRSLCLSRLRGPGLASTGDQAIEYDCSLALLGGVGMLLAALEICQIHLVFERQKECTGLYPFSVSMNRINTENNWP